MDKYNPQEIEAKWSRPSGISSRECGTQQMILMYG